MAEQVNQRIEDMINELEQMRRTSLYNDEEIKEISRRRKEFEYHIQRHVKQKEDYVQYIAYELALLEDISLRRKKSSLSEKRHDIEYAIANRLNKVFKRFIYRFQNDVEIYFEYLKFCKGVGFQSAASGIIGQMLQMHGDKPKMWQLASRWESEEQNNLEGARSFLLKGIQRHPEAEVLYLELFKTELLVLTFTAETKEDKEKQMKRADIVWRNGLKNIDDASYLFRLLDICWKYNVEGDIMDCIKAEIWTRKDIKDVWPYIASKELEGCHWKEIEEFVEENNRFSKEVCNLMGVYEEAMAQFPDEKFCTKYIHALLGLDDTICTERQKIDAVKQAWFAGNSAGLVSNDMFTFGIEMLKLDSDMDDEEIFKIVDDASKRYPKHRSVWEEKLMLCKPDEKKMMNVLQDATKALKPDDTVQLYNLMLDNVESNVTLKNLHKKFLYCENAVLLSVKPKLLQKMYDFNGLKAARELYEDLIRTPPIQLEVNTVMISIEMLQEKRNLKLIRRCYECAVQHHGTNNVGVWMDYLNFESKIGDSSVASLIYKRAVGSLTKELCSKFIEEQTMARLN